MVSTNSENSRVLIPSGSFSFLLQLCNFKLTLEKLLANHIKHEAKRFTLSVSVCDMDKIKDRNDNYVTYEQLLEKMDEQEDFINQVLK